MCIRVQYAAVDSIRPWDDAHRIITLPAGLDGERTLLALRATLCKLDVPQARSGARCWCGEPIPLPA